MLYGRVPWVAQNILELKEKVQSQCITFPKIPFVTMPTRELIFNMLQREEDNRIDWSYLLGDYLEKDIQD